jgi:hypothetical protein
MDLYSIRLLANNFKTNVIVIPLDHKSSFMRGPAGALQRIRELLHAGAMNLCTENGLDLGLHQTGATREISV